MYHKILIPLDSSKTAEQILPYVKRVAAPQAALHLVSVVEPNMYAYALASSEATIREKLQSVIHDDLESYLTAVQAGLQQEGYTVQTWVARGDAAQTIADVATKLHADLIAMTTHGRTGLARWALGSVADRVVHLAHQPILLVRAHEAIAADQPFRQILVPLDGSPLAESALEEAEALAQQTGAALWLVRVVEPLSQWQQLLLTEQGYSEAALEQERQAEAQRYLAQVRARLQAAQIEHRTQIYRGGAAEAIFTMLDQEAIDLVVMSTHGLSGYSRWVYGSIASKVLHNGPCPLLLLRSVDISPADA
ncbi:MAG: universal stress protein [Caldilineaceae bacterium]|nr:universal stress protein [Caldilineaceae bacterium]